MSEKKVVIQHRKAFENTLLGRSLVKGSEEIVTAVVVSAVTTFASVAYKRFEEWKLERDIEKLRKTAEQRYYQNRQN